MNNSMELFAKTVAEFSQLRVHMTNIAHILRTRFAKAVVQHAIDFATYDTRNVVQMYIDVALDAEKNFCWWIDVERDGQDWKVDASLRCNSGSGEDTEWEISHRATSVEELFLQLSAVFREIEVRAAKGKILPEC